MTQVTINFHQRLGLWMRIGTAQVPSLRDAATLIRVLERIRPTEEEMKKVNYKQDKTTVEYTLPDLSYGVKTYEFEDEESRRLIDTLNGHQNPFRIDEAAWMLALIEDLENQMKSEKMEIGK